VKPTTHSVASVRRYGGTLEDYLPIHEFLDMTKAAHPDMRHRAILHNTMGPFIAAQVFGTHFTNSEGRMVDVRQLCEDHIIEDLGRLPTVSEFLDLIPEEKMGMFAYSNKPQRRAD
jgi:hypothetical protein